METKQFARVNAAYICKQFFTDIQPPAGLLEELAVALTRAYELGVECALSDIEGAAKKVEEVTGQLNYTFKHLLTAKKESKQ